MAAGVSDDFVEVEIEPEAEEDLGEGIEAINDDGSIDVNLSPGTAADEAPDFYANLAEELLDEQTLSRLAYDLIESTDEDRQAQQGRVDAYTDAIKRTGLDGNPIGGAEFEGASKAVLPVMQEAAIDFAASAINELFPVGGVEGGGPVKHQTIGKATQQRADKALRKSKHMNWQMTKQMRTLRDGLEELLTQTAMAGRYYLKLYQDLKRKRPAYMLVPMDNLWLPGDASTLEDADRYTHAQYLTDIRFRERVASGMYRDLDLVKPSAPEHSAAQEASDQTQGKTRDSQNKDGTRLVREIYVLLELDDDPETDGNIAPYIVSIDDDSGQILSVYRAWDINDPQQEAIPFIIEFPFIPWRDGPIGLPQLIGGLSIAGTGALRALLDAGHISNVSGALKLKGGGADKGKNVNVVPGMITEIESSVVVDDIRKAVMPLPFNPPSPVLFSLLGFVEERARGVVNVALEKLAESKADMPVGTVLALIEQGSKVYKAIHSRLHRSMERALVALHHLNRMHLDEEALLREAGDVLARKSDYQGAMDVEPVSDPNIFSEAQRYAQTQAIAQRAVGNPLYDQHEVEKRVLAQLRIPDSESLLVKKPEPKRLNPVNENMAMAMGSPVVAFPDQDHAAHLMAHFDFVLSPMFGRNPVIQPTLLPGMVAHIKEHMLYLYVEAVVGASDQVLQMDPQFKGTSITDLMDDDDEISKEMDRLLSQTSATFI